MFPGEGAVPNNYGAFYIEAMDASGAWVSSTVDLLRFLAGVDGRADRPDILSAATRRGDDRQRRFGMSRRRVLLRELAGSSARPKATRTGGTAGPAWHDGHARAHVSHVSWVALFNANPLFTAKPPPADFKGELDAALWNALAHVTSYPTHDLFSTIP